MTLRHAFAFFTFTASNEGFHLWSEQWSETGGGGWGRDDERGVEEEVKSSLGEGVEAAFESQQRSPVAAGSRETFNSQ